MSRFLAISLLMATFVGGPMFAGEPLFTENFDADSQEIGRGVQFETGVVLKHSAQYPGWTKQGQMPVHFAQQGPGDWSLMFFSNAPGENTVTQSEPFDANERGKEYAISVDVGPGVYAAGSQRTLEGDQLKLELLRQDGSVMQQFVVSPRAWDTRLSYDHRMCRYAGDGSGALRFRISPSGSAGRFYGAIDNLQVFNSEEDAVLAYETRRREEKEREDLLKRLGVMERDWLFQAGGNPDANRIAQEIVWTRELAARLLDDNPNLDLSKALGKVAQVEAKIEEGGSLLELYLELRKAKRQITFKNPVIDFSQILLIDNPYPLHRHESMHRQGYQAGDQTGDLVVLEGLTPDSPTRSLLPKDQHGFFWRPDLSFDATEVLFCMKPADERSFHLYKVNVNGTNLRQLTVGDYDDLDPIFLPDGGIMFSTTRGHTYVRCGPRHHAFVLARANSEGEQIYVISYGNEPDYLPTLLNDGRIVYTRWEYTDKEQKRVQGLWTMNPDGTHVASCWGNQSVWPDILAEPRPIPNDGSIMFTGVGHHQWFHGSIGIVDPRDGMNYPHGVSKVTPEIAWPEVGNGPAETQYAIGYHTAGNYTTYKTPYPISKDNFLVSINSPVNNRYCLYLMDVYGNRELIYGGKYEVWHAMPLKPRAKPPVIPNRVVWPTIGPDAEPPVDGVLFSSDVFEGAPGIPRDQVKYLRVIQSDYKTYSSWVKTYQHQGPSVSVTQADAVKRVLGTTPVKEDGSVCFYVPSGKTIHFQLLDAEYRCIQTMRSFAGVMPGEWRGCIGCHEGGETTPAADSAQGNTATKRGPRPLEEPPWGPEESVSFMRFAYPVLDRYCAKCHGQGGAHRDSFDVTLRPSGIKWSDFSYYADVADPSQLPDSDPWKHFHTRHDPSPFVEPYVSLVNGGNDWYQPTNVENFNEFGIPVSFSGALVVEGYRERDMTSLATLPPMSHCSSASQLIEYLTDEEHIQSTVDSLSLRRMIAWIDCNGPYMGDEEVRALPDPSFGLKEDPPVIPRLKNAPIVNRFNIRQDGDSEAVIRQSMEDRNNNPQMIP